MTTQSDIGVAGLAVMGENLVLNMAHHDFSVSVYNRTGTKTDAFLAGRGKDLDIRGFHAVEDFVNSIARPRKIMMMLKAGSVVDDFIQQLLPFLDPGDTVIDGGNSNFEDSKRRCESLEELGFFFVGSGVSGGEEGALNGPSIMPGGSTSAWPELQPIFSAIAAKVTNRDKSTSSCCAWMGSGGAGHFVKMVHNGIEYGDMQLICEAYHLMSTLLKMSADEIHQIFSRWNRGILNSYLIEITADIMAFTDETGEPMVEKILDYAGQKGTGKLTAINALQFGTPLSLISESVFARCLSSQKELRLHASKILNGPKPIPVDNRQKFIDDLEQALYMAKVISYAQGFSLLFVASKEYKWNLNFGEIAKIWRGGCIIRSTFLDKISDSFEQNPHLPNLLLSPYFAETVQNAQYGIRRVVSSAVLSGVPIPALASALSYYDGFRSEKLPANLLQAQRDYFGAHTYERIDKPRGEFFHTNWTGTGGNTTSTSYNS